MFGELFPPLETLIYREKIAVVDSPPDNIKLPTVAKHQPNSARLSLKKPSNQNFPLNVFSRFPQITSSMHQHLHHTAGKHITLLNSNHSFGSSIDKFDAVHYAII
jgi:hypothetical protein